MKIQILLVTALLTGCGGGGGGGGSGDSTTPAAPAPPPNESISGIWEGTATGRQSGFSNAVSCLITQTQEMVCLLSDASTGEIGGGVQGTVSVSNTNEVAGSGDIYAASGYVLADGSTFSTFTITSGTIDERTSLVLVANAAGDTWDLDSTFNTLYDRDATLSMVAGVYSGWTVDGVPTSLSIDANGVIFAQSETGCVGNGEISVLNSQFNEYDMTMTVSSCPGLDGDYDGLAVSSDFQGTDDLLVFGIFTGQQAIFGTAVE